YVKYDIIADDTLAVITLTAPYRSQILAATAAATDVAAATSDTSDTATDTAAPQFVGTRYIASAST
ncbi:MAG: hypothetical protein ACI30K_03310, partial [Muribaculaceae bacterium]